MIKYCSTNVVLCGKMRNIAHQTTLNARSQDEKEKRSSEIYFAVCAVESLFYCVIKKILRTGMVMTSRSKLLSSIFYIMIHESFN